ncbi:MAG: lipoyl synthase [Nitrospirae bacterium GWC2_57_13]|nr:MAG: lipoyl synthase [Nitrospirae bacterium GWC2_57_13]
MRPRSSEQPRRLPPWFKMKVGSGRTFAGVSRLIQDKKLHTVCRSAGCPNRPECWSSGTATFMILGNICTRGCRFCGVPKGIPAGLDRDEPGRVADAVAALDLRYAVITSVTRDDLPDGGAGIFAETVQMIRDRVPGCRVETLIPDFQGCPEALRTVLDARPDVLNHNIETIPSLYARVRPQADYKRSLELLHRAAELGAVSKTGLMLGLGEEMSEVRAVMKDLRSVQCGMLTLGQYLQPDKSSLPVEKYYHPDEFRQLAHDARALGFAHVQSGPLVRSSYHAGESAVIADCGVRNK